MKCNICGKEENPFEYNEEVSSKMIQDGICHSCMFWQNQHLLDEERGAHRWAIIDGTHYVLADHNGDSFSSGSCGREHRIQFTDGYVVKCDNLWCQGNVPAHFRDIMPDNAKFV